MHILPFEALHFLGSFQALLVDAHYLCGQHLLLLIYSLLLRLLVRHPNHVHPGLLFKPVLHIHHFNLLLELRSFTA
jgi:hypothetical protein